MKVEKKWFKPEAEKYFFGEFYEEGDNSLEGFYPGNKMNLKQRTKREVDGLKKILQLNKNMFILDAPCGYGRHSIDLFEQGFKNIHGIDLNHYFINKIIKKTNIAKQFKVCELNNIMFKDSYFDVVMNMFFSFGFYESDAQNLKVLEEIYRVLKPGGVFLMHTDVNIPFLLKNIDYLQSNRTLNDSKTLEVREVYNKKNKRLDGYWRIKSSNHNTINSYSMRVYSRDEFVSLCKKVGFTVTTSYRDFDGNPYSKKYAEMIITAKKRG